MSDKLDKIFDAQAKFRKLMGKGQDCIVDLMDEKQKGQLVYDHVQAISSELQELINCIYWKSWAKEAKEGKRYMFRNVENAKEEVADILCFLGDICAALGMSAQELADINIRKTEININRQLTKYAMDTKDGKDSEQLWNEIKEKTAPTPVVEDSSDLPLVNITELARDNLNHNFLIEIEDKNGVIGTSLHKMTGVALSLAVANNSLRAHLLGQASSVVENLTGNGKFEIGSITLGDK